MAKRKFKLPGVDDLNKDQDKVLRLPENGQFLIVGGPGTGKSVVALLRIRKFSKNNNYQFLAYNKTLSKATLQMVNNLKSETLLKFFNNKYESIFQRRPEKNFGHDFKKIILELEKLNLPSNNEHLIIDEGQDMSIGFYESLFHCGYENFFIVADQNQQITNENSSRQELTNILGLEVKDVIELKQNYRNSHSIALFSQEFWTDPASPKPELPSKKMTFGMPTLYEYSQFNACIEMILRESDKEPTYLIGIIVAKQDIQQICLDRLHGTEIKLDNEKAIISSYSSSDNQDVNIDFTEGGIVVLNDKSVKGLEFDIVFVMINGFRIYNNDIDSMKKRFYVMSSRAIKKLIFFKSENYNEGIEDILPDDENILKKERLRNG